MKNIILLIFISISITVQAQTVSDALRYSNLEVGGTARTVGVGGGIGALGADYSVLSTNPAGLAAFRTNEFVVTPGIYNSKTTSLLERGEDNTSRTESIAGFNLSNIGMVLNYRPYNSKWTTFNLGIGYNRLASFGQEFVFEGKSNGSIVDRFTELANDGIYDEFEVQLADEAIAIYSGANPDEYTNDFEDPLTNPDYQLEREQFYKTKGSYSELVFALAGNFDEKIMVGATIGVPFIDYEETKVYEERDVDSSVIYFNELTFREELVTSGVGVNLKLGMIYKVNQMLRLGAAVHTPTAFRLTDDSFSTQLIYDFTDGGGNTENTEDSPLGDFKYRLKTPWRVMANAAVLINRKGFITADVEYIDYSVSSFNLTSNSTSIDDKDYEIELNQQVGRTFKSAVNLRIGGEYAYDNLRFRAGFGINGTPYADSDITNKAYSLGFGVREKSFYIDFAYKYTQFKEGYVPYLLSDAELEQFVTNEVSNTRIIMTAGFKF